MNPETIEIVRRPVPRSYLQEKARLLFGDMIKAVVDIERCIIAIGGELHADEERLLLEDGSRQVHLWGINLYTDLPHPEWLEFDSMINLRPNQGNRTRGVDDQRIQAKIVEIVTKLIES